MINIIFGMFLNLCCVDCPKSYILVNDTQQDAYHKSFFLLAFKHYVSAYFTLAHALVNANLD
jgi:hypothetical protein